MELFAVFVRITKFFFFFRFVSLEYLRRVIKVNCFIFRGEMIYGTSFEYLVLCERGSSVSFWKDIKRCLTEKLSEINVILAGGFVH